MTLRALSVDDSEDHGARKVMDLCVLLLTTEVGALDLMYVTQDYFHKGFPRG